tara:strand:+ start:2727 stop:3563 length:837 start_codon:yes stop_codon:yes gene_type:complete
MIKHINSAFDLRRVLFKYYQELGVVMFADVEFLILIALFFVALLYSSVGHGGASGYLAVLSLTAYAEYDSGWLKQHAWCLNLAVASIAFYHYRKAGFHVPKLTLPFIITSIPFAIIGGSMKVDGNLYDTLLSITLIWAAYRLFQTKERVVDVNVIPKNAVAYPIGGAIGLVSGFVGVGGGIFLSPILLLKGWATPKNAAATASLFILLNSISGLIGAGVSGQLEIDFETLIPFVFAVLIGGFIGSKYGSQVAPQSGIKYLLIFVLIIASIKRILMLFM